jgi:hypothetical protein
VCVAPISTGPSRASERGGAYRASDDLLRARRPCALERSSVVLGVQPNRGILGGDGAREDGERGGDGLERELHGDMG